MSDAAKQPRRRPRFSLLNLVLAMTIVAMGFGIWREHLKREPLEQQIGQLRREAGVVRVGDPKRVYVNSLFGSFDNFRQMRWRAYVPAGAESIVTLKLEEGGVGLKSIDRSRLPLPAGESTFQLIVSRKTTGDDWVYSLCDGLGVAARGSGPLPPWYTDGGKKREFSMKDSDGLAPGESHEILREKATRADGSWVEVVLTIERAP